MLESQYTSYHALVQKYNRVARLFSGAAVYPQIEGDFLWADQSYFLCGQDVPTRPTNCSIPQMFWGQYILDTGYSTGWQAWQFLLCNNPLDLNEMGSYTVADLESFLSNYFGFQLTQNQFLRDWTQNTLLRPMPQVIALCSKMLDLFRWRVRLAVPRYSERHFNSVQRTGTREETIPAAIASCLAATPNARTYTYVDWTLGRRAGYTASVTWGESPCVFNGVNPWYENTYLESLNPNVKIYWEESESSTNGATNPATMHPRNVADLSNYDLMQGTSYTDAINCIPTDATTFPVSLLWSFTARITAIDCTNLT